MHLRAMHRAVSDTPHQHTHSASYYRHTAWQRRCCMGAKGGHGRARWHLLEGSASVELEHLVLEPLVGLDHGCSPVHLSPAHWSADAAASRAHGALCACQPARGRPFSTAPRSLCGSPREPSSVAAPTASQPSRAQSPPRKTARRPAPRTRTACPARGMAHTGMLMPWNILPTANRRGFFFSKKIIHEQGTNAPPTNIAFGRCRRSQASMLTGHRRGGR